MPEAAEMVIDVPFQVDEVTPLPPRTLAEIRTDLNYDRPVQTRENAKQEWADISLQVAESNPTLATELKGRGVHDSWISPKDDDWIERRSSPGQGFHTSASLLKGFAENYPHVYQADPAKIPEPKITSGSSCPDSG